jgi:hypothetical protein
VKKRRAIDFWSTLFTAAVFVFVVLLALSAFEHF